MARHTRVGAVALITVLCLYEPLPLRGEEACPEGWVRISPTAVINHFERRLSAEEVPLAQEVAVTTKRRMAPEAEKTGAPSPVSGSTSLVDSPAFTEAVKLAYESGLVSSSDGVLTVDLNLFAFKAAQNQWLKEDQWLYDAPSSRRLRRFGGAVSFGGTGETFDRNGDGEADEPLQAEELGDVVTYEIRYRIYGSRDRREAPNVRKYLDSPAAKAFREAYQGPPAGASPLLKAAIEIATGLEDDPAEEDGCVPETELDERFEPYRGRAFEVIKKSQPAVNSLLGAIDKAPILTLAAGGVSRETDFGTDELYFALRYAWGSLEAELLYKEKDAFSPELPDPTTYKLGAKYSWYVMEGILGPAKTLVSLEGSYEHFNDVPDAEHDTVSKVGLKTEYQVSETLKVPLSVTWANHVDLLSEDDDIRGHIGIAFDVGNLLGTN